MRALIRAALNERALERYILTWLGDSNGLNTYFESWAFIRDNESSNLLPSIAAGQCWIQYLRSPTFACNLIELYTFHSFRPRINSICDDCGLYGIE